MSTKERPPARRTRRPSSHATIEAYRETLIPILRAIDDLDTEIEPGPLSTDQFRKILRRYPKDGKGFFSRAQLLAGFRMFGAEAGLRIDEPAFIDRLSYRAVRTMSGVTPVAVLTKPHPCPGQCIFCPNDVRMPKSYLSDEPAAQRAEDHGFDPYAQTWSRLAAFAAIGHPTDKVELIFLGGTFSFYPAGYQRWFVMRCFEALNDFGAGVRQPNTPAPVDFATLPRHIDGRRLLRSYNDVVRNHADRRVQPISSERADWTALRRVHRDNEAASTRCVGLVAETRPDYVTDNHLADLRAMGFTKLQIGLQSLSDEVLEQNKRGHTVAQARDALVKIRAFGFKIHAHWMLNLLGSDPRRDREDFDRLFEDDALHPDELKVYPCSLVESAELMRDFEAGRWRPYSEMELLDVLVHALRKTPRYCRLSRVVRDIPGTDIVVGSRKGNLHENAEALAREKGPLHDIRAREIRRRVVDTAELTLRETHYRTRGAEEVFIEYVDAHDRVAAFARLSMPRKDAPIEELEGSALLREVHVYGLPSRLSARNPRSVQHRGLGKALVGTALKHAKSQGFSRLSVISAVGTREYYRHLGFEDGELYQHAVASPETMCQS